MRLNAELAALLASAGAANAGRPLGSGDLTVIKNVGTVPPATVATGDFVWNRGFDLVVVSANGVPSHFCKCRPAGDVALERETDLLSRLSRDPGAAILVPETHGAESQLMRVQVSQFIEGEIFSSQVDGLSLPDLVVSVDAILEKAELICARAEAVIPDLARTVGEPVSAAAEASGALSHLTPALLTAQQAEALRSALLSAGQLPRRVQHGDLWPGNVVWGQGVWHLLDFEMLGRVQVPLFDVCHLLRTCLDIRIPRRGALPVSWLAAMAADDDTAVASRQLVSRAAARYGLAVNQAVGAVVFYVVEMAARIHHLRGPQTHWEPYVNEARRVADALLEGSPIDRTFLAHRPDSVARSRPGAPGNGR